MDPQELLDILRKIATRHEENRNDPNGDKYLSDTTLISEVVCDYLLGDDEHDH